MVPTLLLYFILVLLASVKEMSSCQSGADVLEGYSSAGDARKCFDEKTGNVSCQKGTCGGDKECRTGNAAGDIACLVNACQVDCGHSRTSRADGCIKDCLSLDDCGTSENAAFYINCVRNSRGVGFWTAYRSYIIGITVLCLIIGVVLACYCLWKLDDKAFNAALKENPHPSATAKTANNPEVSFQVAPKMAQRNPSATSVGPAALKAASSPQISAA